MTKPPSNDEIIDTIKVPLTRGYSAKMGVSSGLNCVSPPPTPQSFPNLVLTSFSFVYVLTLNGPQGGD